MPDISIITTSDGSHSLLNAELNETYHSVHGALRESLHVFIKHGFDFVLENSNHEPLRILEIGFGTGLNALLTLQRAAETKKNVHYTSLEAYPVTQDIWEKLNYTDSLGYKSHFEKLHGAKWNEDEIIHPHFTLLKVNDTLQHFSLRENYYHLVYFDAFAPNKQPEMWELPILKKVADAMSDNGVFVTYCAKGQVKRDLKSLHVNIETLQGPPGKKEMVRARKLSS